MLVRGAEHVIPTTPAQDEDAITDVVPEEAPLVVPLAPSKPRDAKTPPLLPAAITRDTAGRLDPAQFEAEPHLVAILRDADNPKSVLGRRLAIFDVPAADVHSFIATGQPTPRIEAVFRQVARRGDVPEMGLCTTLLEGRAAFLRSAGDEKGAEAVTHDAKVLPRHARAARVSYAAKLARRLPRLTDEKAIARTKDAVDRLLKGVEQHSKGKLAASAHLLHGDVFASEAHYDRAEAHDPSLLTDGAHHARRTNLLRTRLATAPTLADQKALRERDGRRAEQLLAKPTLEETEQAELEATFEEHADLATSTDERAQSIALSERIAERLEPASLRHANKANTARLHAHIAQEAMAEHMALAEKASEPLMPSAGSPGELLRMLGKKETWERIAEKEAERRTVTAAVRTATRTQAAHFAAADRLADEAERELPHLGAEAKSLQVLARTEVAVAGAIVAPVAASAALQKAHALASTQEDLRTVAAGTLQVGTLGDSRLPDRKNGAELGRAQYRTATIARDVLGRLAPDTDAQLLSAVRELADRAPALDALGAALENRAGRDQGRFAANVAMTKSNANFDERAEQDVSWILNAAMYATSFGTNVREEMRARNAATFDDALAVVAHQEAAYKRAASALRRLSGEDAAAVVGLMRDPRADSPDEQTYATWKAELFTATGRDAEDLALWREQAEVGGYFRAAESSATSPLTELYGDKSDDRPSLYAWQEQQFSRSVGDLDRVYRTHFETTELKAYNLTANAAVLVGTSVICAPLGAAVAKGVGLTRGVAAIRLFVAARTTATVGRVAAGGVEMAIATGVGEIAHRTAKAAGVKENSGVMLAVDALSGGFGVSSAVRVSGARATANNLASAFGTALALQGSPLVIEAAGVDPETARKIDMAVSIAGPTLIGAVSSRGRDRSVDALADEVTSGIADPTQRASARRVVHEEAQRAERLGIPLHESAEALRSRLPADAADSAILVSVLQSEPLPSAAADISGYYARVQDALVDSGMTPARAKSLVDAEADTLLDMARADTLVAPATWRTVDGPGVSIARHGETNEIRVRAGDREIPRSEWSAETIEAVRTELRVAANELVDRKVPLVHEKSPIELELAAKKKMLGREQQSQRLGHKVDEANVKALTAEIAVLTQKNDALAARIAELDSALVRVQLQDKGLAQKGPKVEVPEPAPRAPAQKAADPDATLDGTPAPPQPVDPDATLDGLAPDPVAVPVVKEPPLIPPGALLPTVKDIDGHLRHLRASPDANLHYEADVLEAIYRGALPGMRVTAAGKPYKIVDQPGHPLHGKLVGQDTPRGLRTKTVGELDVRTNDAVIEVCAGHAKKKPEQFGRMWGPNDRSDRSAHEAPHPRDSETRLGNQHNLPTIFVGKEGPLGLDPSVANNLRRRGVIVVYSAERAAEVTRMLYQARTTPTPDNQFLPRSPREIDRAVSGHEDAARAMAQSIGADGLVEREVHRFFGSSLRDQADAIATLPKEAQLQLFNDLGAALTVKEAKAVLRQHGLSRDLPADVSDKALKMLHGKDGTLQRDARAALEAFDASGDVAALTEALDGAAFARQLHIDFVMARGAGINVTTDIYSFPGKRGHFRLQAHGTPYSLTLPDGSADAKAVAAFLRNHPDYVEGMPVILTSCSTGSADDGLAQQLSKLLGVEVHAPTTDLDGATGDPMNGGTWKVFTPDGEPSPNPDAPEPPPLLQ